MADKAFMVLEDDTRGDLIFAKDLSSRDKLPYYLCPGCNPFTGEKCGAKLSLVISSGKNNFFRTLPTSSHIPFCKYDESGKTKIIEHLDCSGQDTTIEKLFARFNKSTSRSPRGPGKPTVEIDGGDDDQEDPDEENRRIERRKRNPRNLGELCDLLAVLEPDDQYADCRVGDIFIDSRSIEDFRVKGFQNDQCAIVIAEKTTRETAKISSFYGDKRIVLRDSFSYRDGVPPLFFVFNTDQEGRDKLFKSPKGTAFAVFGKWAVDETRTDLYHGEYIAAKNIIVL
jgi:hypothetical protein